MVESPLDVQIVCGNSGEFGNHHRMVFRERQVERRIKILSKWSHDQRFNRQLLTQEGNKHREGAMGDDEREREEREKKRFAAMTRAEVLVHSSGTTARQV